MSRKKGKNAAQQIAELEVKQRSGFIRMIAAIAGCVVVIVAKLNLTAAGVEWANSTFANAGIFILALVLAGVAGYGSRSWYQAKSRIRQLQSGGKGR